MRIFVNGTRETIAGIDYDGGALGDMEGPVGKTGIYRFGGDSASNSLGAAIENPFSGYLSEIHFVDGQSLGPGSFGVLDAHTGRWKAIAYTGEYGSGGFYLNFVDNSNNTASTIGKDSAPITGTHLSPNNWTPINIQVTGTAQDPEANDSVFDSPSDYDPGSGAPVRGNYCTWDPYPQTINGRATGVSDGNLKVTNGRALGTFRTGSFPMYWEVTCDSLRQADGTPLVTSGWCRAGVGYSSGNMAADIPLFKTFGFAVTTNGLVSVRNITDNGTWTNYGTVILNRPYVDTTSTYGGGPNVTAWINAGQKPFSGSPPNTSYRSICTTNMPFTAGGQTDFASLAGTGTTSFLAGTRFDSPTGLATMPSNSGLECIISETGSANSLRVLSGPSDRTSLRKLNQSGYIGTGVEGNDTLSGSDTDSTLRFANPTAVAFYAGDLFATGKLETRMSPSRLAMGTNNELWYTEATSDGFNNYSFVKKINVAGQTITLATFGNATAGAIAVSTAGEAFVWDAGVRQIKRISTAGVITTLASFNWPRTPAAFDLDATYLYFVSNTSHELIRVTLSNGAVTVLAGTGSSGSTDGTGTSASFNAPTGLALDPANGMIFISDSSNHVIRRYQISNGEVTTVAGAVGTAGSSNGPALQARFTLPGNIKRSTNPNTPSRMFIVESSTNTVRFFDPYGATPFVNTLSGLANSAGYVDGISGSTLSGTTDTSNQVARLSSPTDLAVDSQNAVLIADFGNRRIRVAYPSNPVTIATTTRFRTLTFAGSGLTGSSNYLGTAIVTDTDTSDLRAMHVMVRYPSGNISFPTSIEVKPSLFIAGQSAFSLQPPLGVPNMIRPGGVTITSSGVIYFSDFIRNVIYKVAKDTYQTEATGVFGFGRELGSAGSQIFWTTAASLTSSKLLFSARNYNGGSSNQLVYFNPTTNTVVSFGGFVLDSAPVGVVTDSAGNIYVAQYANILKISTAGVKSVFVGPASSAETGYADGTGGAARFFGLQQLAIDSSDNLYVADMGNRRVRKITPAGVVTTFAGTGASGNSDNANPLLATFSQPSGVAIASNGDIYVSDSSAHNIRKIAVNGEVSTFAGSTSYISGNSDGQRASATFNTPNHLAFNLDGSLLVADTNNHRIRTILPSGIVLTLVGLSSGRVDGIGSAARLDSPFGITVSPSGDIYVKEGSTYGRIVKISYGWTVSLFAGDENAFGGVDGTGTSARFNYPVGLARDGSNNIYVADVMNHKIRKITPAGVVTSLAGATDGSSGSTDGTGTVARFNQPWGVAVDSSSNVFVIERTGCRVRRVTQAGVTTTIAGNGSSGSADGTGTAARFNNPQGIMVNSADTILVADTGNHTLRQVTQAGVVTTLGGLAGSNYTNWEGVFTHCNGSVRTLSINGNAVTLGNQAYTRANGFIVTTGLDAFNKFNNANNVNNITTITFAQRFKYARAARTNVAA